jgi:chemotaxis protein histidine kinase CheA
VSRRPRDSSALFDVPVGRKGRVESGLDKALGAARRAGSLADVDAGVYTLARALARGCDVAEAARDVWALARVSGELRETLMRMRLDPVSRGSGRDQALEFLRDLANPEYAAADPGAEVRDPEG